MYGPAGPGADYAVVDGNREPWGHAEAVRANGTVRAADPTPPSGLRGYEAVIKGDAKVFCAPAGSQLGAPHTIHHSPTTATGRER